MNRGKGLLFCKKQSIIYLNYYLATCCKLLEIGQMPAENTVFRQHEYQNYTARKKAGKCLHFPAFFYCLAH
ncbi:hypothetical protein D1B31_07165 [Neobacillus notoginsengisoli]|uniref:Uncharacterized protein n=1 Tax=Neobacillus notoginsengisoli TaxID=1578198 RepID=A0A417YVV6_9BACI|nr:hypothetical protein D1B31_07165 [Neobacillus notoginsengisoli]